MENAPAAAPSSPLRLRFSTPLLGSALLLNVALTCYLAVGLLPYVEKQIKTFKLLLPRSTVWALECSAFVQIWWWILLPSLLVAAILAALIDRKVQGFLAFYAALVLTASTAATGVMAYGMLNPVLKLLTPGA